jgi:hypothetical protein
MSAKQRLNFANCTRKERLTFPVVNSYQIDIIGHTGLFAGNFSAV